jgi:hypothetical protein
LSCQSAKAKVSGVPAIRQTEEGENKMKNAASKFATVIVMTTAFAVAAHAQSRITVNVPFTFVIADRTFSAGVYSLSSAENKFTVQDSAGKPVFMGIVNHVSGRQIGPTGQVVFHCYERRCFLSEFWTPTRDNGSQLLPSRYEREIARHQQKTEFALLDQKR